MKSRVNVVLAERRITKRELERRLGLSHSVVWRWTTDEGISSLPLHKLKRMADAIGCDVSELYEDDSPA